MAGFVEQLDLHVRARYPLIWLVTHEEARVDRVIADLAQTQGKELHAWSVTTGLRRIWQGGHAQAATKVDSPLEVLDAVGKLVGPAVVVLKDFHPYLAEPTVVRRLRELAQDLKGTYNTVCLVSPVLQLPVELEKDVTVIDVPLPGRRELFTLLRDVVRVVRGTGTVSVELDRETAALLGEAAQGLTLAEAESAFAKAMVHDQRLSAADLPLILEEKRQVIRKSGLLEYFAPDVSLADVGGLELLKAWLQRRGGAFSEAARRFGLPEPRGLLLLGVQGGGKSLTAKAVASAWNLPLLRLDVGRIFSGLVGSSEENMRRSLAVAEAVAPVVLWLDEIEKGLGGVGRTANDGGVSQRVFGTFLTWMQEKTRPVFVVATANRIDQLPPELLRKGRFDEIFFVDLPGESDRAEILAIHVRKRGRDPASFDLPALARMTSGFSGAELEQLVVSALFDAFAAGRDLAQEDLARAAAETAPLSRTLREEIDGLREWARDRTRPASGSAP